MTSGKPPTSPIGMNSISIKDELLSSFEDTYNVLLDYIDIVENLVIQLAVFLKRE
jgi:hypothetical protein